MTKTIEKRVEELARRVAVLEKSWFLQAELQMVLAKIEARARGWSESAIEDALKHEADK